MTKIIYEDILIEKIRLKIIDEVKDDMKSMLKNLTKNEETTEETKIVSIPKYEIELEKLKKLNDKVMETISESQTKINTNRNLLDEIIPRIDDFNKKISYLENETLIKVNQTEIQRINKSLAEYCTHSDLNKLTEEFKIYTNIDDFNDAHLKLMDLESNM